MGEEASPVSVLQELTQLVCLFARAQKCAARNALSPVCPFTLLRRLRSVNGGLSQFCLLGFGTS